MGRKPTGKCSKQFAGAGEHFKEKDELEGLLVNIIKGLKNFLLINIKCNTKSIAMCFHNTPDVW